MNRYILGTDKRYTTDKPLTPLLTPPVYLFRMLNDKHYELLAVRYTRGVWLSLTGAFAEEELAKTLNLVEITEEEALIELL